jgi:hypothetical protein
MGEGNHRGSLEAAAIRSMKAMPRSTKTDGTALPASGALSTKRRGDTALPPNVNPRTIAHAQPRDVYPQIAQMYADKTVLVFVFASSRLRAFA